MAKKATNRAVLYLRRSTDRQEKSIEDQRASLLAHAAKHGYKIVGEYVDDGINGRFRRAFAGHNQPLDAALPGRGDGDRQRAPHRSRAALQGELADGSVLAQPLGVHLAAADQQAERDRQIERGGLLGQLGRSQVDHDPVIGPQKARIDDRPFDTMRTLFDGSIRKPDKNRLGHRCRR